MALFKKKNRGATVEKGSGRTPPQSENFPPTSPTDDPKARRSGKGGRSNKAITGQDRNRLQSAVQESSSVTGSNKSKNKKSNNKSARFSHKKSLGAKILGGSHSRSFDKDGPSTPKTEGSAASPVSSPSCPDPPSVEEVVPNMDMVFDFAKDLDSVQKTSDERAARALRHLFTLSEHSHEDSNRNRELLVHDSANGTLVPVLLNFLRRCPRGSHEQYLALLVLNNVSIPAENKRVIAIDCLGAAVLSRLLCLDPSCHLMVIVLVNLTFADGELRRELVDQGGDGIQGGVQLVDALSYAFRVANLSPEDAQSLNLPHNVTDSEDTDGVKSKSPRQHLASLTAKTSEAAFLQIEQRPFDLARLVYPETGRWCLCALKNLTRPSKLDGQPTAAHALMDAGIIPLILNIITVCDHNEGSELVASNLGSVSNDGAVDPIGLNVPWKWEANSMQDAALFTIVNLAATPDARGYLKDEDAICILDQVTKVGYIDNMEGQVESPSPTTKMKRHLSDDEQLQNQFQCLKARMALAYLAGGEGHFGQSSRMRASSPISNASGKHGKLSVQDVLLVSLAEASQLVRLLADTLHQRAKDGPGGYSAATFTTKGMLHAIRCLLTQEKNQITFIEASGLKLSCLLIKALARHSILQDMAIDSEAAEYASWSLYLLSNSGFKKPFLPETFNEGESLVEKVLTSFLRDESISPAARHAVDQILLRLPYLIFQGDIKDEIVSDYLFDSSLKLATESTALEKRSPGTKPLAIIFDRPILRSRAPKRDDHDLSSDTHDKISEFPSALHAVQQLSYGSSKVRHMGAIDDILIANNIAGCADGLKTESYNYWWSWKEATHQTENHIKRSNSNSLISEDSGTVLSQQSGLKGFISKRIDNDDGPFSFFGLRCGVPCAGDDR